MRHPPTIHSRRLVLALSLPFVGVPRTRAAADDSVAFSHQTYSEDHGRIQVQTETLRVQKTITPSLDLTLRETYDGISGATPIGAPPVDRLRMCDPRTGSAIPPSSITGYTRQLDGVSGASQSGPTPRAIARNAVPLTESPDDRAATDIAIGLTHGPHRLVPEFSFSNESDYRSYALALNYTYEFNDKNTTLNLGLAHSYDEVLANQYTFLADRALKNTDDLLVGGTQLLSPTTLLGANLTLGYARGYLNDPYRGVVFDESDLDPDNRVVLAGEQRPSNRASQSLLLSLTQSLSPNSSIEGTYRFYHDTYGIFASTLGLAGYQKVGRSLVLSPSARYYRQTAADFYATQFPGDPTNDPAAVPRFYSADYRLSAMETFTLGFETTIKLRDSLDLRLGYQRYWMHGLDHETTQSTYPSANIFTIGLTYTF